MSESEKARVRARVRARERESIWSLHGGHRGNKLQEAQNDDKLRNITAQTQHKTKLINFCFLVC